MFGLGISHRPLNKDYSFESIELLSPEQQISKNFEKADLGTKADMIDELWHKMPSDLTSTCHSLDISQNIMTGLNLYNRMRCAGQAAAFAVKLNETALLVFNAATQGLVKLDKMDNQAKAEFFAMAYQCIELKEHEEGLRFVKEKYDNLLKLLSIPKELAVVVEGNPLIESNLVDIAVDLLAATYDNVQAATTLFYNPRRGQDVLLVTHYLKELAQTSMDNVQNKLGLLRRGQILLIPVKSSLLDPLTLKAGDGHFSSVLAVKAEKYYQFFIFDSNSAAGDSDNINIVIRFLMENLVRQYGDSVVADYHIHDCRQYLLFDNECGVHAYNFFEICCKVIEHANDDINHHIFEDAFKRYAEHINFTHLALKEDKCATSKFLRIEFVLDCIKNGYMPDMLFSDRLHRLYKPIDPDSQTVEGGSRFWVSGLMRCLIPPFLKNSA